MTNQTSREQSIQALSRVLVGLAWSDGRVTTDEINLLKDLIFSLPETSADEWAALDIYWMMPIRAAEMEKLSWDLMNSLVTDEAKSAVKDMLNRLVNADGEITSEETSLLRDTFRQIDREDPLLITTMDNLLQSALPKRKGKLSAAANREDYIQDFIENRVFVILRERFGDQVQAQVGLEDYELRKLALAGALMGKVAYADQDLSDFEIQAMEDTLKRSWSLHSRHAAVVVEFALDAAQSNLDSRRLVREFYEASTEQERADFVDILFDIARSEGGSSGVESKEIEYIAFALKLPYATYKNAFQRSLRLQQVA